MGNTVRQPAADGNQLPLWDGRPPEATMGQSKSSLENRPWWHLVVGCVGEKNRENHSKPPQIDPIAGRIARSEAKVRDVELGTSLESSGMEHQNGSDSDFGCRACPSSSPPPMPQKRGKKNDVARHRARFIRPLDPSNTSSGRARGRGATPHRSISSNGTGKHRGASRYPSAAAKVVNELFHHHLPSSSI